MDGSMSFIWFAFYGEFKYIKFGTDSRDYLIYFINYVATLQDGNGAVLGYVRSYIPNLILNSVSLFFFTES